MIFWTSTPMHRIRNNRLKKNSSKHRHRFKSTRRDITKLKRFLRPKNPSQRTGSGSTYQSAFDDPDRKWTQKGSQKRVSHNFPSTGSPWDTNTWTSTKQRWIKQRLNFSRPRHSPTSWPSKDLGCHKLNSSSRHLRSQIRKTHVCTSNHTPI